MILIKFLQFGKRACFDVMRSSKICACWSVVYSQREGRRVAGTECRCLYLAGVVQWQVAGPWSPVRRVLKVVTQNDRDVMEAVLLFMNYPSCWSQSAVKCKITNTVWTAGWQPTLRMSVDAN